MYLIITNFGGPLTTFFFPEVFQNNAAYEWGWGAGEEGRTWWEGGSDTRVDCVLQKNM